MSKSLLFGCRLNLTRVLHNLSGRGFLQRKRNVDLCCRHMSVFEVEQERLSSFVKELYIANIDMSWVFPFPTLENSRDLNSFNESLEPLQRFLSENEINSAKLDEDGEIPTELIDKLRELRLFGLSIPQEYGGLGLTNLKLARVFEEISCADNSVNMMIASHNLIGTQPILKFGTDEQKQKYLPKLASGEIIAGFCCNEVTAGSDVNMIRTRARLSQDGKHWLLSGEKTSVNNGAIADLMIVFAKIEVTDVDETVKDTIGAFIVEKEFGGIYNGPQEDKMGMRALNTSDIMFDETPVPLENMIGEERDGFKIAMETLNDSRLGLVCGIIGPMRELVKQVTAYADSRVQFGRRIKDFQLVKEKIYSMAENIYVMESVAYLTMGKYDQAEEDGKIPDLSVESAIAKIIISQKASEVARDCMEIFGHRGYTKGLSCERILRDATMLTLSEGTTDVLKLYIALSCFKHSQNYMEKRIKHYNPRSVRLFFRVMIDNFRDAQSIKDVRRGMMRKRIPSFGLSTGQATKSWLDHRLNESGEHFEESVLGFNRQVFSHLRYFGNSLQEEQLRLRRFADLSISLYAMIAVIARCNKSLVLGLRDCDREYHIASTFIYNAYRECGLMMEELKSNFGRSQDSHVLRVGKELLDERRYAIPHPLELEHKYLENPIFVESFDNILKSLPK